MVNNTSGQPTVHYVEPHILGVLTGIPNYNSGDHVSYGGAIYIPRALDGRMVYVDGNGREHFAEMNTFGKGSFYCS